MFKAIYVDLQECPTSKEKPGRIFKRELIMLPREGGKYFEMKRKSQRTGENEERRRSYIARGR